MTMIKSYKVELGRYNGGTLYLDSLESVKGYVYDADRFMENNQPSIDESIDYGQGWEYEGRNYSVTELLDALNSDLLWEARHNEAQYRVEECMPDDYDDQLEDLEIGETLEIYETNVKVTVVEEIPETEEEKEELEEKKRDFMTDAIGLL